MQSHYILTVTVLCLRFIPGTQLSQKRHTMDWFLQLFSYNKLHKLGMRLWNQVPLPCKSCTCSSAKPILWKSSWNIFLQGSLTPAFRCPDSMVSLSVLYLNSPCTFPDNTLPTFPEVASGNIKQEYVCALQSSGMKNSSPSKALCAAHREPRWGMLY